MVLRITCLSPYVHVCLVEACIGAPFSKCFGAMQSWRASVFDASASGHPSNRCLYFCVLVEVIRVVGSGFRDLGGAACVLNRNEKPVVALPAQLLSNATLECVTTAAVPMQRITTIKDEHQ